MFFNEPPVPQNIPIDVISLSLKNLEVTVGGMEYVAVSIKPASSQKDIKVDWSYDSSIIDVSSSDNYGVVITGKKAGNTSLQAKAGRMSATCVITVSGIDPTHSEEPYLYSNYSVLEMNPGISQRVHVSLFGGNAGDMDGFSWTTDKQDIVTLEPNGQYCMISAKNEGSAKITITHPLSTHAYSMYVYVFGESMTSTYITTADNIVTINRAEGDKTISVDLQNPIDADYMSEFSWEIISDDAEPCMSISSNRETAIITPKKSGSAFVRVSHPESAYPLDILIRVVTIVENIIIEPSETLVTINGSESQTITAELTGLSNGKIYSPDEFTWALESQDYVEYMAYGNQIVLSGKANGAAKVIVNHPMAAYSREIMVLVRNQENEAIDTSTYITTSQNYIRTKVGADPIAINIMLYGGVMGDERNFTWEIDNTDIIEMETTHGTISSRAVASYAFGTAHLTPLREGTAVITISHPKSLYSTEILVKVLDAKALLEPPLYISTPMSILTMLNGATTNLSVSLLGNKTSSDEANITWEKSDDRISLIGNGTEATVTANGPDSGMSTITINHPKAETSKKILVLSADTQEELDIIKALYVEKTHYNITVGDSATLILNEYGLSEQDINAIVWTSNNTTIATVESAGAGMLMGNLTAHAIGETKITARVSNSSINQVEFSVSVYPAGTNLDDITKEVYFTTRQNVIVIPAKGQSKTISIKAVGLEAYQKHTINWQAETPDIISLDSNGESATFTALAEGETIVSISHPDSQNTLRIACRVENENIAEMKALYAEKTHYNVTVGDSATLILNEYGLSEQEMNAIMWTSNDTTIATVESAGAGMLMGNLTALAIGETKITARIPNSSINPVEFTVLVYPDGTDLNDITKEVYFTTRQNVVVLPKSGQSKNISVSAIGLDASKKQNITWEAETPGIISISANGESGTFTSLKEGETIVSISHPESQNTLRIMCRVGSEFVYDNPSTPYISASSEIISLIKDTDDFMLQAILVDGENSQSGFSFSIDNTSIASITSSFSSGKCFIKPIEAGQAELTINHPESQFNKKVLIVVANTQEELEGFKYLSTAQNVITLGEGNRRTVTVSMQNSDQTYVNGYTWVSSNPAVVGVTASGATAVFTGNSIGTATITVRHNECQYPLELIAICVDPIAAVANPYITTPAPILTLTASTNWTTINAELVGGKTEDNADFSWMVENTSIAQLYGQGQSARVRATAQGVTYVNVSHPKAQYPMRVLLICDEAITTNCHISVPESIINMKPTDSAKTISATLVNGSAEDKYDFTWYCDTYDVVELNYSANIASIRPLRQGETTIHIKHPKAAYEQKIIVKVSEYTTFGFGSTNKTITEGTVSFQSMQIPVSAMETHVEYSSNANNVVTVSGTKNVAQLTGVGEGTAIVTAKLIATSSNTIQATSEILVYCKKADSTLTYITSPTTTFTLEKNMTRTLNADIIGPDVNPTDVRNLQWESSDTNIIKISGVSTTGIATGNQIIVQAMNSGECTITITHEKSNSPLVLYFIVPGSSMQEITLNKTFITMESGSSTEIKASIPQGQTADYKAIVWDIAKLDNVSIASLMGSGQTVSVYAQKPGITKVRATLPNGNYAECDIRIESARSLSFLTQTLRLQPGESKSFNYTISPADAEITWYRNEDTFFDFQVNTANQIVTITGKKEGNSSLTGITNYGNKASVNIAVAWDYNFQLGKSVINAEPKYDPTIPDKFIIPYTVNPENAEITVNLNNDVIATYVIDRNKKQIILTPTGEGTGRLTVEAKNPDDNDRTFATRTCELNFRHRTITLIPTIISQNGSFSNFNKEMNMLTIGDGETVKMQFAIAEQNVDWEIKSISFIKQDQTSPIVVSATGADNVKDIVHPNDQTVFEYLLIDDTYYTYNGNRIAINWIKCKNDRGVTDNGKLWYTGFSLLSGAELEGYGVSTDAIGIYYAHDTNGFVARGVGKMTVPYQTPRRVSIDQFKANTDWYVPAREVIRYDRSAFDGQTHYYYPGEYFINNTAELVPVIDTGLATSKTSGYIQVEILRSGLSEIFQIPVITETRNCTFDLTL
jgi:hypothetical protein